MLDLELACTNTGEAPLEASPPRCTPTCASTISMPRAWPGFPGLRYRDSVLQRDELQRVELLLPGDSGVVDLDRIYFQARSRCCFQ